MLRLKLISFIRGVFGLPFLVLVALEEMFGTYLFGWLGLPIDILGPAAPLIAGQFPTLRDGLLSKTEQTSEPNEL